MEHSDSDNAGQPEKKAPNAMGPESESSAQLVIPEHQLVRCIGRGSYGQVWLARSTMGVYRAIKIVYRKTFESQRPFERELSGIRKFEPISRLHEGFIDLLQVGINDEQGYFYYIMELGDDEVSGQRIAPESYSPHTLASDLARRGKLSLEECLRLGVALSDALAELHKRQLVHRDIKPSNIIFVGGAPKLADIGLVADVQQARSYVGTEGFIPPEGPGTPQADLFGLGKVLYEASTGKDRHDFPELPTQWSESPEYGGLLELNEVILQSCHREPAKRYASARDMHADLLVVVNGKSVKRLRTLERRLANLKHVAAIGAVALGIAGVISYNIYREWRVATDARRQQVSANIAYGNRAMDSGDLLAALPYFAQALRLDHGNPERETTHRLRYGSVLSQCPKLTQVWFGPTRVDEGQFSPDGRNVLLAEHRGKAMIYDLQTAQLYLHQFGPANGLRGASYSPDGKYILTASEDNTAIVWDATTLEKIGHLPHTNIVFHGRFSPDGLKIVTACFDGYARLWNASTHQLELTLGPETNGVAFADFSHDGRLIATASYRGLVHIWHTNGQATGLVLPHSTWVTCLNFSPDDQRLVTTCYDHKAHVWDLSSGKHISPALRHDDAVVSAEFSPDNLFLLTASFDGTARLWRADDLQALGSNPILRHGERLTHASFSPDGRLIITTCTDGSVRIWDLAGIALPPPPERRSFSRDGNRYLVLGRNEIEVYDTASGKTVCPPIHTAPSVEKAELSHDGRFVLSTSLVQVDAGQTNYLLQVCDAATGLSMGPGISATNLLINSSLSDDGRRLVTGYGQTVQVWTVSNATALSPIISLPDDLDAALISPRGDLVATISGTNACIWEAASGQPVCPCLGHPVSVVCVEFSGDGEYLVTCCSNPGLTKCFAQVWNVHTGRPVGPRLRHADGVLSACFSRDRSRIVTASEDYTAKVWKTATGKQIGLPLKHGDHVRAAAFSSDAKWVATASVDKTARVWDPVNSDPLTPPLIHLAKVMGVFFLRDDRHLVTIDKAGLTFLWQLPVDDRPTADLTELAEFLSGGQFISNDDDDGRPSETLKSLWQRLRAKYPDNFSTSKAQIERWHELHAEESELHENWFAVRFHLERLLSLRPDDRSVSERLAKAQKHLKRD